MPLLQRRTCRKESRGHGEEGRWYLRSLVQNSNRLQCSYEVTSIIDLGTVSEVNRHCPSPTFGREVRFKLSLIKLWLIGYILLDSGQAFSKDSVSR